MPLVEKEVIRPGCYWYKDETTGLPRKLVVTAEQTKYWNEQGNAMLSAGLTVPVPFEHDFNAHPMTPAEKLLNNSGWVKEYRRHDGNGGPGDRLFSVLDIQDEGVAKKLPGTIRWTSPWINSFTDGAGKEWKNVISHVALTTRPRIVEQAPFGSIAAALSMASETKIDALASGGICLSRAGRLAVRKSDHKIAPMYPMAFSMWSGAALGDGDFPPKKDKKPKPKKGGDLDGDGDDDSPEDEFEEPDGSDIPMDDDPSNDDTIDLAPFGDSAGDVSMVELLCDLLGALGITCENSGDEAAFKRNLYNAAMTEIHNLTGKAKAGEEQQRTNPPGQPPNNPKQKPGAPGVPGQPNPLVQQEQQPMFMSLEDINKLDEPLKSVALSMHAATVKANTRAADAEKVLNSLRDGELKKASEARVKRVGLISKLMPRVKPDLDAMLSMPGMDLSMGDGGAVVDPMAQTLAVLEKGLADLPRMLTTDSSAFTMQPQPTDADALTEERITVIADGLARQMGCPPVAKAS